MKIIITENQLKDKVFQMVKTEGWYDTCEMLGMGMVEVADMFFNGNPMEYLNLYNDLDVVKSEKDPNWTLFRYKPRHNLMIYDRKSRTVFIYKREIWTFLRDGFTINDYEISEELIEKWLSDTYNLRGVRIDLVDYKLNTI